MFASMLVRRAGRPEKSSTAGPVEGSLGAPPSPDIMKA